MIRLPQDKPRQRLLFAALTVGWAIWVLLASFQGPHLDISALYMAGWFWGNGQPDLIYLASPGVLDRLDLPEWQQAMADLGTPTQTVTPFVYPPIWAAVFSGPAHAMAPMTFFKLAYLWHMLAALASAVLAYVLLNENDRMELMPWGVTVFAILFGTWPVLNAFLTNQPQITINLMIIAAFLLVRRGHGVAGGALLGLAAAFKVAPIMFALIFVINRNWRALLATLVVSGGVAILSIVVMGWPLHQVFLARLSQINDLVFMVKINYAPEALLFQFNDLIHGVPMVDGRLKLAFSMPEPLWLTVVIKGCLVASLALFWRNTRALDRDIRVPVQLFLLSLITALFGPLSWAHYFFLPALLLPVLFVLMPTRRAWIWIGAVLIVTSLAMFSLLHRFNHYFMMTALVPTLLYLALLADTLRASAAMSRAAPAPDPDPERI